MNVGYGKIEQIDLNCPICGKDVYVAKHQNNYACVDIECPLGHGAKELLVKINDVLKNK